MKEIIRKHYEKVALAVLAVGFLCSLLYLINMLESAKSVTEKDLNFAPGKERYQTQDFKSSAYKINHIMGQSAVWEVRKAAANGEYTSNITHCIYADCNRLIQMSDAQLKKINKIKAQAEKPAKVENAEENAGGNNAAPAAPAEATAPKESKVEVEDAICSFCNRAQNKDAFSKGSVKMQKTDSDKDGMPDEYEKRNKLNPEDAADANLDADNDGFSNLQEYQAGTDPQDKHDNPTVYTSELMVPMKALRCEHPDCRKIIPWSVAQGKIGKNAGKSICPHCEKELAKPGNPPDYEEVIASRDRDHDGMPDEFEKRYGLDPKNPADADEDKDKDGFSNFWEFCMETDPANPTDHPSLDKCLVLRKISSKKLPFKLLSVYGSADLAKKDWSFQVEINKRIQMPGLDSPFKIDGEDYVIVDAELNPQGKQTGTNVTEKNNPEIFIAPVKFKADKSKWIKCKENADVFGLSPQIYLCDIRNMKAAIRPILQGKKNQKYMEVGNIFELTDEEKKKSTYRVEKADLTKKTVWVRNTDTEELITLTQPDKTTLERLEKAYTGKEGSEKSYNEPQEMPRTRRNKRARGRN